MGETGAALPAAAVKSCYKSAEKDNGKEIVIAAGPFVFQQRI
jgi:hypothetical protein